MRKGKKSVNYCPVFKPCNIEVIGIDKDRCLNRLMIASPQDCPEQKNPVGDNRFTRIYVII
jgi:hypothetical protein